MRIRFGSNSRPTQVTGTTRVDIEGPSGTVLPGGSVSAGLTPPSVEILSAEGGSAAAVGETVTLSWEANDIDGDPLSFDVQYSSDNGHTWETIEQNLTGTSVDIDLRNLTRSDHALFRVMATDGIHTSTSVPSAQFEVPNHPPTVRIVAPARPPSGPVIHIADTPLTFCAEAGDADRDAITVTWSSSVDGPLGSGTCVTVAQLSVDLHTINVTVADGKGGTASDQIQVQVYCFTKCSPSGCTPCATPRPDELIVAPGRISCDAWKTSASLAIENKNPARVIDWHAGYIGEQWLRLSKGSGTAPDYSTTLGCDPGQLPPGRYTAVVSFFSAAAPTPQPTVVVELTVATPTPPACVGDCDLKNGVTVSEILSTVNVALGNAPVSDCPAGDANGDGQITIDEILTAVNNALNGCG